MAVAAPVQAQEKPLSLVPLLNQDGKAVQQNGQVAPIQGGGNTAPQIQPQNTVEQAEPKLPEKGEMNGTVLVQPLGSLDEASVGTLGSSNGGFGPDMWRGTPPSRIKTLLSMLPVANSPSMQDMSRRLLLTAAAIPQGGDRSGELLSIRIGKLRESGHVAAAAALLDRLPASALTPELEKSAIELLLLQGKNKEACDQVNAAPVSAKGRFWEKVGIFCELISGEMTKAEIGISLLEEEEGRDGLFFALFDRLDGGKAALPDTDQPLTPLHFAMMSVAGLQMSYAKAEKAGYDLLWALAKQTTATKDSRFMAAYASLAVDSLPADLPRQLIKQGALEGDDDGSVDLRHIAALYRQTESEHIPEEKARLLSEIWASGDQDNSYLAAGRLSLPLLQSLDPGVAGGEFELDALGLLLMNDDNADAMAWERAIRRAALRGTEADRQSATRQIARADAYMLISGLAGIARWTPSHFKEAAFAKGNGMEQPDNLGFVLAMLAALDEDVPDALWAEALGKGQMPETGTSNVVISKNLEIAADADRIGETVALSLAALGDGGPANATVGTLSLVVRSLQKIGLEKEARRLALEAAVLRNL
ncbi:MAG: hypothetical protein EP348_05030 [Alphaproteobacteria bacterium]|nr:MAG: hypothetical protein EP348_05030 [Alphaproteobacteria bacterium]